MDGAGGLDVREVDKQPAAGIYRDIYTTALLRIFSLHYIFNY